MQEKKVQNGMLMTVVVYLSLSGASVYHGMKYGLPLYGITANVLVSLILATVLVRYVKYSQTKNNQTVQDSVGFLLLFVLVNFMMAWGSEDEYGYLWLLPVVLITVGTGMEHGVIVYFILLIQNIMLHTGEFNSWYLLLQFLYGVFVIWVLSKELWGKTLVYLFISLLSVDAVLQILQYQFQLPALQSHKQQVVVELISVVCLEIFLAGYLFYRKYQEAKQLKNSQRRFQEELEAALQEDHVLLIRLQEHSRSLMGHSRRISSIAAQAAEYMGANVLLAQAGGLYHEIGKIKDPKNYLRAGVELLEEYHMPKELTEVVSQHSTGTPKPQSMEAAIVMMADCIISTSNALEKKGKRDAVSDKHLVEVVFQHRIAGGNLEESGLSEEEISRLQEFYMEHAFATGREDRKSQ